MRGLGGRDRMGGGDGDDSRDAMGGGLGVDLIFGGTDDDFISSIGDNARDFADCGPGTDAVDQSLGPDQTPKDVYRNCERIVG